MREMTGGCLSAAKFDIQRTPIQLLSRYATARTVRSRLGLLSQFWLAFQKQRFQFKATLKPSTILATAVNQLIETSVRNADRQLSLTLLLCLISGSSKPVLSTTRAGWNPKMHVYCDSAEPSDPYTRRQSKIREDACVASNGSWNIVADT